jgi:RHS repeat-associated protein
LRKVGFAQSSGRTLRTEVRYLPGLEIHRQADGEEHHVVSIEAGRSAVRALHWPEGVHDDQLRYSLSDHLGSNTLELDDDAGVLTQEHYYPFGGTACWAGKSALVAQYKTIRYSGKERDATGLYYYGYRYYAPWLQRWLNPDPAKEADGINMFCFVGNNPVVFKDLFGLVKYKGKHDVTEITMKLKGASFLARGHSEIKKRDPLAAKNLDEGMEFAKIAIDSAVDILGGGKVSGKYKELIFRVYGKINDKPQFMSDLLQEAKTIQKSIVARIDGEEKEQVVLAKMKEEMNAFVDRKDSHERIFFTEAGLRKNPRYIGMSIVHELAHLKLGKEDHIYYTSGHAINPSDRSQSALEADLVSMGEKDSVIATNTEKHVSRAQRLKHFGVDSAVGIEAAMKKDPALRVSALINNADSFSLLIFSLGYEAVWQKTLAAQ